MTRSPSLLSLRFTFASFFSCAASRRHSRRPRFVFVFVGALGLSSCFWILAVDLLILISAGLHALRLESGRRLLPAWMKEPGGMKGWEQFGRCSITVLGRHKKPRPWLPVFAPMALFCLWLWVIPHLSFAFAPARYHHPIKNVNLGRFGCASKFRVLSAGSGVRIKRLFQIAGCGKSTALKSASVAYEDPTESNAADAKQNRKGFDQAPRSKKDASYAAILKVIDESHHDEAAQLCPYIAPETVTSARNTRRNTLRGDVKIKTYQYPVTPLLSGSSVESLRAVAQSYFEERRENVKEAWGTDRVELRELLPTEDGGDIEWRKELDDALTQKVYPLVRSSWPLHDSFIPSSDPKFERESAPILTVASATVFSGGGYPGSGVSMTTFERDSGLFVVHIDLGNDNRLMEDSNAESCAMGALYLESLAGKCLMSSNDSIVGPLSPGQMVVHRSMERSSAIIVPSNIKALDENSSQSLLDTVSRRSILRAAESAQHFSLRLVLTTTNAAMEKYAEKSTKLDAPEAPPEERSYRLRSYARFSDDRVRYLTLAGILDVHDYENHLWLGFDYVARVDDPDYEFNMCQRLSDVNRAIFHLEKAAELCPTDARIHFQLATAIGAKMDIEKHLLLDEASNQNESTGQEFKDESAYLSRMADALERSASLESAAVKLGVNGIHDLAICSNALAETRCKMGELDKCIEAIDWWAEAGSIRSSLAFEETGYNLGKIPSYEWIRTNRGNENTCKESFNVAVRTVGEVLFEPDDVALVRNAADRRFAQAAGIQTSRYTMQYEGNSEVHLDDLCAGDASLKTRMDQILQEKIYPLVRAAFSEDVASGGDQTPLGPLCVYDSIFVRYNGDVAKAAGCVGASQPLHQDGGIYSVNIALNADRNEDRNGFTGGGTFLEALTVGDDAHIQRPIAPGHAIIHKTTQRHAGAPTTGGVRDILVIFLTARRPQSKERAENTWKIERAMRLQSIAKQLPREKLIPTLQLARINDPMNSEMPYWLGVHLIQGDMNDPSDQRWDEICQGVESLKFSTMLNPADARAHYHLGMGISTQHKYAMRTKRAHLLPPAEEAAESLINALETAVWLERKCETAGCRNGINCSAAYLALGDFMARLKNFNKAVSYLNQVEDSIRLSGVCGEKWAKSMLLEASSILEYCDKEIAKKNEASFV